MLTGDLVRVRSTREGLKCSFVDPAQARMQEKAAAILGAFEEHVGQPRGALDDAMAEVEGDGIDHKLTRGLAKLCFDRSEFDTDAVLAPFELRKAIFGLAARMGPVIGSLGEGWGPAPEAVDGAGPARTAHSLYEALGVELGLPADRLEKALYADLPSEQTLKSYDVPSAEWLLHRYNLALVQAVLVRARSITVTLDAPKAPELRALCRAVKFHQLLAEIVPGETGNLTLHIEGPASLLSLNTRYGLALSRFFPAVPLLSTPWQLAATVAWGNRSARMEISEKDGLQSHYKAQGVWQSREARWFFERWGETVPDWTITEGGTPLDQGGEAIVVPDFALHREGFTASLEILGFWRRGSLDRRLDLLRRHGPKGLIIAASRKLLQGGADEAGDLPEGVVLFSETIPVKEVLRIAEKMRAEPRARKSRRA